MRRGDRRGSNGEPSKSPKAAMTREARVAVERLQLVAQVDADALAERARLRAGSHRDLLLDPPRRRVVAAPDGDPLPRDRLLLARDERREDARGVEDVGEEGAPGREDAADLADDADVVRRVVEVAERGEEVDDRAEGAAREREPSHVGADEARGRVGPAGPRAGEERRREVDARDRRPAAGEDDGVPPRPAGEVEDPAAAPSRRRGRGGRRRTGPAATPRGRHGPGRGRGTPRRTSSRTRGLARSPASNERMIRVRPRTGPRPAQKPQSASSSMTAARLGCFTSSS